MRKLIVVLVLFVAVSCNNVDMGADPNVQDKESLDSVLIKPESRSFFEDSDVKNLIEKLKASDDTNLVITVDSARFAAVYIDGSSVYSVLVEDNSFIQEQTSTVDNKFYNELDGIKDSMRLFLIWNRFL